MPIVTHDEWLSRAKSLDLSGAHHIDGADEGGSGAAFAAVSPRDMCTAPSRLLVHRSIAEQVTEAVVRRARRLRIGDPFDPATEMGALVGEAHLGSACGAAPLLRRHRAARRLARECRPLDDWEQILATALQVVARRAEAGGAPLLVIDEFPYLLTHSPQLPSSLQHLYDSSQADRAPADASFCAGRRCR